MAGGGLQGAGGVAGTAQPPQQRAQRQAALGGQLRLAVAGGRLGHLLVQPARLVPAAGRLQRAGGGQERAAALVKGGRPLGRAGPFGQLGGLDPAAAGGEGGAGRLQLRPRLGGDGRGEGQGPVLGPGVQRQPDGQRRDRPAARPAAGRRRSARSVRSSWMARRRSPAASARRAAPA